MNKLAAENSIFTTPFPHEVSLCCQLAEISAKQHKGGW